ncbi:MAG: hypothetical protein SAJ37_02680 [Oscillatoria sp. PMC 1068.18]|nr:hypothetical protein [Oscillatoria sp. PMC 1076.18]MEC4987628.1 hypothetical protein [Oscillatoria sp. PMC 1068.18]
MNRNDAKRRSPLGILATKPLIASFIDTKVDNYSSKKYILYPKYRAKLTQQCWQSDRLRSLSVAKKNRPNIFPGGVWCEE